MDSDLEPCRVCPCGRTFAQPRAFINHQRGCLKTKKRLANAITLAKEVWAGRKRRRVEDLGYQSHDGPSQVQGGNTLEIVKVCIL